jgi:hypothetical protein
MLHGTSGQPGAEWTDADTNGAAWPRVDLFWIPLGAGSPIVQASGRLFEAISARRHGRPRSDLYHAALTVTVPQGAYAIEQAPVPDDNGEARGVVAVGPVGLRAAGRFRVFRYEVRCWRNGTIPDLGDAVDSPVRVTDDADIAVRILEQLPSIPTPVWGRDEAKTGDMWNSNSVIAWVLTRSGIDTESLRPPRHGRAPGWYAGRSVAEASDPGPAAAPLEPARVRGPLADSVVTDPTLTHSALTDSQ